MSFRRDFSREGRVKVRQPSLSRLSGLIRIVILALIILTTSGMIVSDIIERISRNQDEWMSKINSRTVIQKIPPVAQKTGRERR